MAETKRLVEKKDVVHPCRRRRSARVSALSGSREATLCIPVTVSGREVNSVATEGIVQLACDRKSSNRIPSRASSSRAGEVGRR